jgi:hypothetical protein
MGKYCYNFMRHHEQEEKLKERNYTYGQARDGTSGDHLGP